jgi:DNA-binding response OmpR family regulator
MHYPKNILLIDDDPDELEILATALRQCCDGVDLIYEKDGQAALKILFDENVVLPDMVFLDWRMPLVSGKDLLSTIRSLHHYAGVPIIVFSGSAAPGDRKEAENLGAFYFMYKPPTIAELSEELKHLFSLNWRQNDGF